MSKIKIRVYFIRLLIVPVALTICAFIAYAILPGRYWPLSGLLLLSVLIIDLATIARPRVVQNMLIGLYSILIGLATVESVSLFLGPAPATSVTQAPGNLLTDHPILGWAPARPGPIRAIKTDNRTNNLIYDVTYTIDENLLRKTVSAADGPTVAFFGDSWTFGDGVEDADTFPQAFADLNARKLRVLNFGFPGYGPQQFLRAIETGFDDQLLGPSPKLIVFTTFGFQAERPVCKAAYVLRAPRYVLDEKDGLRFAGVCAHGLRRAMLEFVMNTAFYRRYFESTVKIIHKEDMDLYIATILRATAVAKEKYRVPVLIVYDRIPEDYFQASGLTNDEIIARLCKGGAAVLDMNISKEVPAGAVVTLPNDGHPTAQAQHARAAVLNHFLDEHMPDLTSMADVH